MPRMTATFFIIIFVTQYLFAASRIGPRLQFLMHARQSGYSSFYGLPKPENIPLTFTFKEPVSPNRLEVLEIAGFQPPFP